MKKQTVENILKLNNRFYEAIAEDFSRTRKHAWQGWPNVLNHITTTLGNDKKVNVLDLGCGNGRFLNFLQENLPDWHISYEGYDTNLNLLNIAKEQQIENKDLNFTELDIISHADTIKGKYNLIVAFGLMHHIPSREKRMDWVDAVYKLASKPGLVIFTFWNYSQDKRSEKAVRSIKDSNTTIRESELDDGDYFLGWDTTNNIYRYIHEYDKEELDEIVQRAEKNSLYLLKTFDADGKSKNLNKYYIFKR